MQHVYYGHYVSMFATSTIIASLLSSNICFRYNSSVAKKYVYNDQHVYSDSSVAKQHVYNDSYVAHQHVLVYNDSSVAKQHVYNDSSVANQHVYNDSSVANQHVYNDSSVANQHVYNDSSVARNTAGCPVVGTPGLGGEDSTDNKEHGDGRVLRTQVHVAATP